MGKPKLNLANFTGLVKSASEKTPDAEVSLKLIDVQQQVRSELGDLSDLTASIKELGVLEPIILSAKGDGRYLLVAGERRYRSALLAELFTIPAVVKHSLTEFQIRQIQVTENNDRENLSVYDEAMGVVDDVEKFGSKEAQKIWNRSESWISKRLAVKRYKPIVLEILKEKISGDLEMLLSLNQLSELDHNEFEHLAKRIQSNESVSREDVRNKVTSVKSWIARQAEVAANSGEQVDASSGATSKPTANKLKSKDTVSTIYQDVNKRGKENLALFSSLQSKLESSKGGMNEFDWVLWNSFISIVTPVIESLGRERALSYFNKIQGELKSKSTVTPAEEVEVMPEGWKL